MKNKGRGFTLVELLAVIVILAIILVIAVPKITDTIKNSKKASFESSAKTIAAQAEKKKMEKEILEDTGSISCSDIVKLNDTDYGNCSITFDGNTAKVSLVGKGKFEGLSVINGTKDNATAGDVKMPEYGKGTTYIKALYDNDILRTANELKKDNTSDANIRYEGANPNNYVSFNDELWRIIGVFGDNIKLVRTEELGKLSWDSSDNSINGGYGVNEWSQADLKEYLNTMYYGGTSVTCYGGYNNSITTCPGAAEVSFKNNNPKIMLLSETSGSSGSGTSGSTGGTTTIKNLSNTAKTMINNYTWNTGAINPNDTTIFNQETSALNTVPFYNAERGSVNGKICTSGTDCNDTVIRTTTWQGYVALPYVTDWAYASSETACATNMFDGADFANSNFDNMTCKKNNWMHYGSTMDEAMWMLSPFAYSGLASHVWVVFGDGCVRHAHASLALSVFPSVYLNSDVKITSGSGSSSDPYILGVETK